MTRQRVGSAARGLVGRQAEEGVQAGEERTQLQGQQGELGVQAGDRVVRVLHGLEEGVVPPGGF